MNIDPQSPMKIEAGLKLKIRKPINAPMKTETSTSSVYWPLDAEPAANAAEAIAARLQLGTARAYTHGGPDFVPRALTEI